MENQVQLQSASTTNTYNQAANLLLTEKQSAEEAIASLVNNGIPEQEASAVVADLQAQIVAA